MGAHLHRPIIIWFVRVCLKWEAAAWAEHTKTALPDYGSMVAVSVANSSALSLKDNLELLTGTLDSEPAATGGILHLGMVGYGVANQCLAIVISGDRRVRLGPAFCGYYRQPPFCSGGCVRLGDSAWFNSFLTKPQVMRCIS